MGETLRVLVLRQQDSLIAGLQEMTRHTQIHTSTIRGQSTPGSPGCWSRAAKGQKGGRWWREPLGLTSQKRQGTGGASRQVTSPGLSLPAPTPLHLRSFSCPIAFPPFPTWSGSLADALGKGRPEDSCPRASGRSAGPRPRAPDPRPGGRTHSCAKLTGLRAPGEE